MHQQGGRETRQQLPEGKKTTEAEPLLRLAGSDPYGNLNRKNICWKDYLYLIDISRIFE
jgi:hypothetical protein